MNTVSRSLSAGDRSFADVVFESGKPVLDCELNLQQDAQAFANALVSKHAQQSGFYRGQTRTDAYNDFSFDLPPALPENSFVMKRLDAVVAGFPLVIEYTNALMAGLNIIQLDAPPQYNPAVPASIKRTDFVFLEVWQALVAPSPQASVTVALNTVVAADTLQLAWGVAPIFTATLVVVAPTDFLVVLGDDTATATNLAAVINSVGAGSVEAIAAGNYVTLYITDPAGAGSAGNGLVLNGTGGFPLLSVTAGGEDRPNKPSQTQLWRHGNVLSDSSTWLADDLQDPYLHAESTQRVQVQYRIRVTGDTEAVDYKVYPDGFSTPAVLAQGGTAGPVATYQFVPADGATIKGPSSAIAYGNLDNGLWIAGDGSPSSAQDLGSLDGYVYAIPIGFVFRHNQTEGLGFGFDPKNNTNGGPTYEHAPYDNNLISPPDLLAVGAHESDRPDGHFCDVIDVDNLLDLRRHVNPMGVDLRAELQYQTQSLLDGKNYTWAIDTVDKQTMANGSGDVSVRPLICDNIGRQAATDSGISNDIQGSTDRGPTVRSFDHICRRFADQPVVERVVVAFYPNDRAAGAGAQGAHTDAPVAILNSAAGSNPILFTTVAAHPYTEGNYIEIVGHSLSAVNRKWVISSTPAADQFTVSYDNTLGGAGGGGDAYGVGVANAGKYVTKAGGSNADRWSEDDQLVLDLTQFDVTTDGGIFDGKTWGSSGAGLPSKFFSAFAPAGTVISNILSVWHDDGNFGADIDQRVQVKFAYGLGTQTATLVLDANGLTANSGLTTDNTVGSVTYNPEHSLVWSGGLISHAHSGSERRIFVEFEISYPRGENGLTNTPMHPVGVNSNTVYPFGALTARNQAVVENHSASRPLDWESLMGAMYRDGHREVQLEYEAGAPVVGPAVPPSAVRVEDELVSRGAAELAFARRVSDNAAGIDVLDLNTGLPVLVDTTTTPYGSSSRQVFLSAGLTHPQTRCDVLYYAQDAIPQSGASSVGYQLSLYYRTNAPQTVGIHAGNCLNTVNGGQLPPQLTVEPMVTSEMLYTGQQGMGSVEDGFPYAAPLDQIPLNDGAALLTKEWAICGTPAISIANFSASTGLLNLPTYVTQDGSQNLTLGSFSNPPAKDAEFRLLYYYADVNDYRPVIMAEPLTGAVGHKVFVSFLARALDDLDSNAARNTTGEDGILFRKNEIVLVVLTRYAYLDANNEVMFLDSPAPNTTSAAVYRTRNLLLTVGD